MVQKKLRINTKQWTSKYTSWEMIYLTKINKSALLVWRQIDRDGKLVETILPFKDIDAFEKYQEVIDEHYGEKSTKLKEADILKQIYVW